MITLIIITLCSHGEVVVSYSLPVITLYNNYLWSGETESMERTIFKPYKRGWRFIATDTWPPQDFETLQNVPPAPEPEPEPVEEIEESETEGAEEKA